MAVKGLGTNEGEYVGKDVLVGVLVMSPRYSISMERRARDSVTVSGVVGKMLVLHVNQWVSGHEVEEYNIPMILVGSDAVVIAGDSGGMVCCLWDGCLLGCVE